MSLWEKWKMAFDDRIPIYRQIVLQFNRAYVRGDLRPGDRIPSIREISANLQVNTNTMQRVYQEMERSGLVSSKRGTGYFITEEKNMITDIRRNLASSSLERFAEEMRALGCDHREIMDELEKYLASTAGNNAVSATEGEN